MNIQNVKYAPNFNGLFFNKKKNIAGNESSLMQTKIELQKEAIEYKDMADESADIYDEIVEKGRILNWRDYYDKNTNSYIKFTVNSNYNFPMTIKQIDRDGKQLRKYEIDDNPDENPSMIYWIEQFDKKGEVFTTLVVDNPVEIMPNCTIDEYKAGKRPNKNFSYSICNFGDVTAQVNNKAYTFSILSSGIMVD